MSRSKLGPADYFEERAPGYYRVFRKAKPVEDEADEIAQAVGLSERANERDRQARFGRQEARPEFSQRSRHGLRKRLGQTPWWEQPVEGSRLAMVTLTYPMDWREVCPDWNTLRAHREAIKERWRREWGKPQGLWAVEFQPRPFQRPEYRQAPHLHMYLHMPFDRASSDWWDDNDNTKERWPWLGDNWSQVVGTFEEKANPHRRKGTNVRWAEYGRGLGQNVSTIGEYLWRESGKSDQKDVPEGFGTGRWWGVWDLPKVVEQRQIDRLHYFENRRVAIKLRDKRAKAKVRRPVAHDGLHVWGTNGTQTAAQLERNWRANAPQDR